MTTIYDTMTRCPHVEQPFSECAIRVITGSSIPTITRFCMTDYPLCPVYKKEHDTRQRDGHAVPAHP